MKKPNDTSGSDTSKKIAEKIVTFAKHKELRLSTVESITGGGVSAEIIRIPGASEVFFSGLVAYDARAKEEFLGLDAAKTPVYSEAGALFMAKTWREKCAADFCIATSGHAEDGEPTFFAVAGKGSEYTESQKLFGDREDIQREATRLALEILWKILSRGE